MSAIRELDLIFQEWNDQDSKLYNSIKNNAAEFIKKRIWANISVHQNNILAKFTTGVGTETV